MVWMRLLLQGGWSWSGRKPLPDAASWRQLHKSFWGCEIVPQMQLSQCPHFYVGALKFLLPGFHFSSFYYFFFFPIFRDHFSFTVFNETFSSTAISNSSIFSLQEPCCFYWSSIPFIMYKAIHTRLYICVHIQQIPFLLSVFLFFAVFKLFVTFLWLIDYW